VLRRSSQFSIVALLLACGLLLAVKIDHGSHTPNLSVAQQSSLAAAGFSIEYRRSHLVLHGTTASVEHEQSLSNIVADEFGLQNASLDYRPGVTIPDAWVPITTHLLLVVAATESGSATIKGDSIDIQGATVNRPLFDQRLEDLRRSLPVRMNVNEDVLVIDRTVSFAALCRRTMSRVLDQKIEFFESSAEIRSSSFAGLDRIIDVAFDCASHTIAIAGHSDASGSELWNRRLSKARAQSVADYMIRAGIAAERLIVTGLGSSQPIADNSTALGRSRNRRIEFESSLPLL